MITAALHSRFIPGVALGGVFRPQRLLVLLASSELFALEVTTLLRVLVQVIPQVFIHNGEEGPLDSSVPKLSRSHSPVGGARHHGPHCSWAFSPSYEGLKTLRNSVLK